MCEGDTVAVASSLRPTASHRSPTLTVGGGWWNVKAVNHGNNIWSREGGSGYWHGAVVLKVFVFGTGKGKGSWKWTLETWIYDLGTILRLAEERLIKMSDSLRWLKALYSWECRIWQKGAASRVEDYSFTEEHLRAHCASLETFKSRVRTENHSHKLGAKRELYKLSVQEQGRLSFLFTVAALIP